MRRKFNKIISAVLVGAMVFGMTACGNEEASTKNTEASQQTESTVTSETTVPTEPEAYTLTYPLDTDYALTYWGTVPYAFDDVTKPYTAGLIERTGINLEATIVASSDATNQYNLLLTEDKLPDLITRNFTGSQLQELYEVGAIWDLAPYLEEYAPDYWAYLNAEGNEELLSLAKDEKGRILSVGCYLEGVYDGTFCGPVILKDWLEECGLPMPVTLEDWEKTLVAFKEKYGATLSLAKTRWHSGISSGTDAMGGITSPSYYIDDNGKVQHASIQPEFKEMLEVLARWNKMGLIDQDSFSQNDKAVRQKVMDNQVGISFTALSQLTNWFADAAAEGGNGAEWVGLSYPRTAAGATTSMIQISSRAGNQKTVVTTSVSEEDLKVVLAWINYGFTEEGFIYQNFGEEGVAHTVDAQGNVTGFTDAVKGSTLSEFINDYIGTRSNAVCGVQASNLNNFLNDEKSIEARTVWTENTEAERHLMPSLVIQDESYTDTYLSITTYINESVLKFILGEEDLANFDAFVNQANEMGLTKCIELQQKAYDEFLARSK